MKRERTLRLGLAQINPTVGDLEGNVRKIGEAIGRAEAAGADILLTPELVVTGYPPEDLLFRRKFVQENMAAVRRIARSARHCVAVVGFVDCRAGSRYNAAAICQAGAIRTAYHKLLLPNYGVFDEKRYFAEGRLPLVITACGLKIGVTICEDLWSTTGPCRNLCRDARIDLLLNISASPYHAGKGHERLKLLRGWARKGRMYVAYCNLVGGQDELVFDGHSLVLDPRGQVVARGKQFEEDLVLVDLPLRARPSVGRQTTEGAASIRPGEPRRVSTGDRWRGPVWTVAVALGRLSPKPSMQPPLPPPLDPEAEIYSALVVGTRDYVKKNGFSKVLIGLSGGIDSTLTAAIAADALGPENVNGVALPSRFTSEESVVDAKDLADRLRIDFRTIPIEPPFKAMLEVLSRDFEGLSPSAAEENLQARIRGTLLMTMSNKFGWLVLTTGNKSEISTGYCTLYGDTAGGFAVIKDIPKTLVYRLSRYRNTIGHVIPDRVLEKAPTAELRANQKDTDSLPPYEVLDPILKKYVEEDLGVDEIARSGQDRKLAEQVAGLVERSEYKRRQAAPGVKITPKAFGRDRRMPLTHRFRG